MIAQRLSRRFAALAFLLFAAVVAPAHAQVHVPQPGSPLRAQILNGLRPAVQSQIGGTIEFVVEELRVLGDWAYVSARPQRPGGARIDWNNTQFRDAWRADAMSESVLGLLYRRGGAWRVVEYAIGPTDVVWEEWRGTHRLPRRLFAD